MVDGYILDGREILNNGKEFYEFGFVRARTSLARVKLTLKTQANAGKCCGPSRGGVFWYGLSSLGTSSTWEGGTY